MAEIETIAAECDAKFCFDEYCPYTHGPTYYYKNQSFNNKEDAIKAMKIDDNFYENLEDDYRIGKTYEDDGWEEEYYE